MASLNEDFVSQVASILNLITIRSCLSGTNNNSQKSTWNEENTGSIFSGKYLFIEFGIKYLKQNETPNFLKVFSAGLWSTEKQQLSR